MAAAGYEELGDYLLRLGLSWIFMTFLAFLTFSGIVTALSTFFLSDDLRLLLTAPWRAAAVLRTLRPNRRAVVVDGRRVRHADPARRGLAECASAGFYVTSVLTIVPSPSFPVAVGTACTMLLVNVFPARRARDLLMLMGFCSRRASSSCCA
jgi:ABC-2 type transport system permease protein